MEHETIINHHPEGITLPPEEELSQAARFLRTIGDPTKLRIVCVLAGIGDKGEGEREREICAGSIAAALGMTNSAISHQLKILRDEGLIRSRRVGKHVLYSLDDDHVYEAVAMTMEHIRHRHGTGSGKNA